MENQIILIKPTMECEKEIINYRSEFLHEVEVIAGSSNLASFEKVDEWLTHLRLNEEWASLPNKEFVPGTQYVLVNQRTKKILGMSHLRLELNDFLTNFGGHIGYSVVPSEQNKGYATLMLQETLKKAKEFNIERVLMTCNDDNLASAKVIENNKGVLENKFFEKSIGKEVRRYWIKN